MSIKSTVHITENEMTDDFEMPLSIKMTAVEQSLLSSLIAYAQAKGPIKVLLNFKKIVEQVVSHFVLEETEPVPVVPLQEGEVPPKKINFYLKLKPQLKYLGSTYNSDELFAVMTEKFDSTEYTGNVEQMNNGTIGSFGGNLSNLKIKGGTKLNDINIRWFVIYNELKKMVETFLLSNNANLWKEWSDIRFFYQVKKGKTNNDLTNVRPMVKLSPVVSAVEKRIAQTIKGTVGNNIDWLMQGSNMMNPNSVGGGINFNCFLLEEFMQSGEEKPGTVLFFDIAKAYSSVNHDMLFQMLAQLIGDDSTEYKYIVNYYHYAHYNISDDQVVYIRKGLIQGSSLSNYLFIIFMDAFLKEIKKRLGLLGVLDQLYFGPDHSIRAFVDDIAIYCPLDNEVCFTVFMTVKAVCSAFKLDLNTQKSRYLHNVDNVDVNPMVNINVMAPAERYLGRLVARDLDSLVNVFIETTLHPLMEMINEKPADKRIKYYRKSVSSRIYYMFVKCAATPAFLESINAFETGYLLNWGMSEQDVNEYLYSRNYWFMDKRVGHLHRFLNAYQNIETPYINALVQNNQGYTQEPPLSQDEVGQMLSDFEYDSVATE